MSDWLQLGTSLAAVLGAIALLRLLLQRLGLVGTSSLAAPRIESSCALGPKQRLCIVEVEGRRLLLGAADGSVSFLAELDAAEPVVEEEAATPGKRWRRIAVPRSAGASLGLLLLGSAICLFAPSDAFAQDAERLHLSLPGISGPDEISGTLEVLLLVTVVSIAPSLLLMATCFTRVLIVLALLRQAIGIQALPPTQVLVGLALFITLFVMAPVGDQIREEAYAPYVAKEIGAEEALDRASLPVRDFLFAHTREADLELFLELREEEPVEDLEGVAFSSLLPAFMISELRRAFEIGFMLYLPFLVVDLVIASMLISMGMIVLPPIVISLPFKLMLFVLMDGWNRVVGALIEGLL